MTTDAKFRRAMYWAGWPVEVMNTDWSIAYKHVSVNKEDHRFHLVEFGGRFFVELALTFGGCSSPTLYNMVVRLLIELGALESGLDLRHSVQQLDRDFGQRAGTGRTRLSRATNKCKGWQ